MDDDVDDELFGLLASAVTPLGLELVDVERRERVLRVVVDRDGGVDLEAVAGATRAVSAALDRHDPVPGRYTLEVSSPGVERPLRTPAHFARAVGETVSVRTLAGGQGERRVTGRLAEADAEGFVLEGADIDGGRRRLAYDEVQRARTVFEWGARPAPRAAKRQADDGARLARGRAGAKAGRKKVVRS
ncbi:MAG TPA: ribosome maturation factor RimP [Acidimicrobiales bacterium]|nr:ribosome maturation factor RimP [Acidimicrobiales bacterium]